MFVPRGGVGLRCWRVLQRGGECGRLPIDAQCAVDQCVECGRFKDPCARIARDIENDCAEGVASLLTEDVERLNLAATIGAKTELTVSVCAAYRAVRLCYAEAVARSPGCADPLPRGGSGVAAEVKKTLPTCKAELARLYESIECDFCDPVPWATSSAVTPFVASCPAGRGGRCGDVRCDTSESPIESVLRSSSFFFQEQ
jgi:hypothetical protein